MLKFVTFSVILWHKLQFPWVISPIPHLGFWQMFFFIVLTRCTKSFLSLNLIEVLRLVYLDILYKFLPLLEFGVLFFCFTLIEVWYEQGNLDIFKVLAWFWGKKWTFINTCTVYRVIVTPCIFRPCTLANDFASF